MITLYQMESTAGRVRVAARERVEEEHWSM